MVLKSLITKDFFGTESLKESQDLYDTLKEEHIRCTCDTFSGEETVKHYSNDPFHVYAKSYLKNLTKFYIIRVHILDFKRAIEVYNSNF